MSFVKDDSNTQPSNVEDQQTVKMDLDSSSDCDSETQQHTPTAVHQHQLQQQTSTSSTDAAASTVRPQVIVTPRKVAAAIESVTAAVLAKNNKTSLADCVSAADTTIEAQLALMPNSFAAVFEMNAGASTSAAQSASPADAATSAAISEVMSGDVSYSGVSAQGGSSTSSAGSPSKSVIVRAGPSVSYYYYHKPIVYRPALLDLSVKVGFDTLNRTNSEVPVSKHKCLVKLNRFGFTILAAVHKTHSRGHTLNPQTKRTF